jgi:hypothetical protein
MIRRLILTLLFASTALADVETQPLYRYASPEKNWLYTTSPSLPAGLGTWTREVVVGHVPRQPSAATRPIYSLVKSDILGVRYAFTSSATEKAAGWKRQEGPAFHVLRKREEGMAPLYRLYAPLRTAGDPDGFSGPVPGTDTHFYTADEGEKDRAVAAGWVPQSVLGYVYLKAQEPRRIRLNNDVKPADLKPLIRVTDTRLASDGKTVYTIAVTNTDKFPSEWFVKAGPALPANTCGDARLLANAYVVRGGTRFKISCESLGSRAALETVTLKLPTPLADDDRVQVDIHDRLLNEHYVSDAYSAGWIGIGPLLNSAGCKSFLGRASSYLCTDPKGFAACESLRKSGKPIACTQAGKKN